MANKQSAQTTATEDTALHAITKLQQAGMGNLMGINAAWIEALGDMGAEIASFVAERIKEDVQTQHEILNCKNVGELQNIQAAFIQKALEQYQAESGKLLDMSVKAFAPKSDG